MLAEDLVTDQALLDAGHDEFHLSAIAKAVGDLTLSAATPVNIALFGPWGSGKSTFYNLMKSRIKQQDLRVTVARYDAWKYGGQALKRNFIQEMARQLELKRTSDLDRDLTLSQEQSRIRLGRWFRYNWASLLGATAIGAVLAGLWVAIHTAVEARWIRPSQDFLDLIPQHISEFGLVLAAVLTALLLGPKALESAVVKTTRPAIDRDDQFARMFTKLVRRIKKQHRAHRLVFFIDELDRCEPHDVVATLIDLKTFLDEEDCVFVVAADREVLEQALRKVPQAKPIREDVPYYSTPGAFIDKIFQHQIALPPLRAHALSSFAHQLVSERTRGLWRDLADSDLSGRHFNDVVYILVPAHVSSPRRVKVLVNNFATSARIAESRHIDWIDRARELAFLTVLATEFPSVAASLVQFPEMLAYLRQDDGRDPADPDLPPDRKAQIDLLDPETPSGESVAGHIVREGGSHEDDREKLAREELARQLHDYLDKLRVVSGLHDPRPDLFFLRVVGYDDGITDPLLGEVIDLAPERQPSTVLAAFEHQPDHIKTIAARLLISGLASQRGTGQANVLESACRLIEQLTGDQVEGLAHLAPEVLSHVGQSVWRPLTTPGAIFLAAAQPHAADQIAELVSTFVPAEAADAELLDACIPALAWMDDEAAKQLHSTIGQFLPHTTEPLATALGSLPTDKAVQAWENISADVESQYSAVPAASSLELFDRLVEIITAASEPAELLWNALVQAIETGIPDLVERIYERREDLLPLLTAEHAACIALFEVEAGNEAHWLDWTAYLQASEPPSTQQASRWARDAASVIAAKVPSANTDLVSVFNPVVGLTKDSERAEVFATLLQQVPLIPWGDATDPDGQCWTNLLAFAEKTAATAEQHDQMASSIADSLLASVTARLPTMTGATPPASLFVAWRDMVGKLSGRVCRSLEAAFASLSSPPTTAAQVEFLRLRIAARRRCGAAAFTPKVLLPLAGEATASVMAGEWLDLKPKVESVVAVHSSIPIGAGPLSRYAASLTAAHRTTLWIALEKDNASQNHLRAVGKDGVLGEAIVHMADQILAAPQQKQRDAAVDRLLCATFAETPTKGELERGEYVGHKQASELALRLIATGINANVVLAARLVIHSQGVAHGTKTRLRSAFTKFGDGKQSRNFTKDQATALRGLELLTPKKKSRWSWLIDRLPSPPT